MFFIIICNQLYCCYIFLGFKKLIFIHQFPDEASKDSSGKEESLDHISTDLLELIEPGKEEKTNKVHSSKLSGRNDDTKSLTELEKQAEEEVNSLTGNHPKGLIDVVKS